MATKKTRLNEWRRYVLAALVNRLVKVDAEVDIAAAQAALESAVRRLVTTRYPQDDMAVLLRYDVARKDACVRLRLTDGRDQQVYLTGDDIPLSPHGFCRMILADQFTTDLYNSIDKMATTAQNETKALRAPYIKLIKISQTFEDVVDVWAEAEQVRDQIGATATGLVRVLDVDETTAIQADMARRAATTEDVT